MEVFSDPKVDKKEVIERLRTAINVCMHVLGEARTDVRVKRAAAALVAEEFGVSVVDIETNRTKKIIDEMAGVVFKHVYMPPPFASTRFEQHMLTRVAKLFLRSMVQLLGERADIYHAHDISALPACYLASRLRRKPLVFDAHELPLSDKPISEMSNRRRWLHRLLSVFFVHMLHHCAGIITVSPPIAEKLRTLYHVPEVTVVRNVPVYQSVPRSQRLREHLGLGPEVHIALYQGNVQPDRGLDRLIRASRFLDPNIVLVLMGKAVEPTLSQLEELIISEGVAERVRLLPAVPYSDLLYWTASADLGLTIFPPDYSLSIRYTLPNKLFEYLMAGLPVLSSQLDAVVEVLQAYEVGRVASSLDPQDLAAAINGMFADPIALEHMRRNALQAAREEFHWEKEQQRLITLYRQILHSIQRLETSLDHSGYLDYRENG
jgi:glycosyltransferase involved in cell wall biosynthesis